MIDYAINALLITYVAVMAIWLGFMLTGDLALIDNTGFGMVVLALMIPYHLLRRKRNRLEARAKELQDTL